MVTLLVFMLNFFLLLLLLLFIKLEFIKFTSHAKQAALIQALPTPYSKEIPALYSIADEMLHYHIKSVDSQVEIQRTHTSAGMDGPATQSSVVWFSL